MRVESRLQRGAGNHAVSSRLARRTLAREVVWKDYFDEDSEQDMGSKTFDFDQWCAYRAAREGYEKADLSLNDTVGSLLEEFENEYQVMLMIVSDAKMDKRHLGEPSLARQMQGSDRVYVGEGKASKWMPLVRDDAWAIITVGISYGENAGTVMHTINHELSMHGKGFLELLKLMPESPVATLKVGDIQMIDLGGRSVRVERVAEDRFKLWYTPAQQPYNVKVGARIPGSTLKKDGRTYLAPI